MKCNCTPDMQSFGCTSDDCIHNPKHRHNSDGVVFVLRGKKYKFRCRESASKWLETLDKKKDYIESAYCCCSVCGLVDPPF